MALALGLFFGLGPGNPAPRATAKSRLLLQASVVGLGFGLNVAVMLKAGMVGLHVTAISIAAIMITGWSLGRLLRIDGTTTLLVSAGTSICGGSAIAAVGSAIEADARAMSVALAIVFSLNAIALFIFPLLGHSMGLSESAFGLWAAVAIHDTSSVVGAAAKYGDEALAVATTVKLVRTLWILPLALALGLLKRRRAALVGFPWFILFFVLAAAVRSLWPEHETAYQFIKRAAVTGLTLSLFLIGAGLSRESLKVAGAQSLILGVALWIGAAFLGLLAVWMFATRLNMIAG
ncbi:MAG TPA: putative sulfate exporter family transporter [Candidatus Binatia bacterium]|nr:putative sulfate exporter family transporter [Candidatus Binatia bacterium]